MITIDFQTIDFCDANSTILDIGCGAGRHTAAASDLQMGLVVGADTDPVDLNHARTKLRWHDQVHSNGAHRRWALAGADIRRLPFKSHSMDLVICSEVLEHIADHERAVAECSRIVKPGRHLVVSVPRRWPETICWGLSHQYRHTQGGHLRIYRTHQLIDRIQATGMSHWRTHYAHSLHTPFWWLKCLLGLEKDQLWPVAQYHRFLTWDLMAKPCLTRLMENLLNPLMGKSVVLYFRKSKMLG